MQINFTKMHGLGNDYHFIESDQYNGVDWPELSRRMSHRHLGAGADGIILIEPSDDAEFATDFGPAQVTHICLNDDTVEGVALRNGMAYSVQYHPESAAGPHDANPLFDQFEELMANHTPNK